MRICIFGDACSPHIQRLVPGLVARGLSVRVVTYRPAEMPGATVELFQVPPPGLSNLRRWRGRRRAYLEGIRDASDVLNVQFLADWGFDEDLIAGACLVVSPWGSDIVQPPGESIPPPEVRRARIDFLRNATTVTSFAHCFAEQIAAFAGIGSDDIVVLPWGVDTDRFRPQPSLRRNSEPARVGFFKGFREVYGAEHLVRAWPIVEGRLPGVRLQMVGGGGRLGHCQRLAESLGVCRSIDWIPRQSPTALPAMMGAWRLSVIPSLCEAFGVAALESAAMELPVVASDVGGLRETVRDGRTGLLVPPGEPEALADAIVHLLTDAGLRRRMGSAGRRMVVREYELGSVLDRWVAAFARAREEKGSIPTKRQARSTCTRQEAMSGA